MIENSNKGSESTLRRLFGYFLQGVIILAPIIVSIYALYWLFDSVDSILRPYLRFPGLGFIIIILFIILVGWVSSNFLLGGMIDFVGRVLERTPVLKFLYTSTKDFFEAFAGDKKRFNKAVLANVFADDVWVIGFLTDEEMSKFELGANHVAVYVPQAYNFAGQLYVLPKERVRKIHTLSSGEAMKYTVTGGVADTEEEKRQSGSAANS